jgi:hypothetical protein
MNNTMVPEIHGAKINPKSSLKNYVAQNTRGRKLREQMHTSLCFVKALHVIVTIIRSVAKGIQ